MWKRPYIIRSSTSRGREPPGPAFSCPCVLGVVRASCIYDFSQLSLPNLPRFIKILDSVLHHLVPAWDHTLGTFSEIKVSLTHAVLVLAVGTPLCSCNCSRFIRKVLDLL